MTGFRSIAGYAIPVDNSAMHSQRPVSALTTLMLRNQVQHLVDCSVQQRINWHASTSSSEYGAGGEIPIIRTSYAYVFPTTIVDKDTLPSYDIRIATRLTGTLTACKITASLNFFFVSPTRNVNIYTQVFDVASATAQWAADDQAAIQKSWSGLGSHIAHYEDVGAGAFLASTPDSYVLVRFEVAATTDDIALGNVQIIGISLREYL